jgi:hypothetical protein
VEGETVIESALLLVSGAPLGSSFSPGSSMSGSGTGSCGSSGFSGSVAGPVPAGAGEAGVDGVRDGGALGRAEGVRDGFGVAAGRDGSGRAEEDPAEKDPAEPSGTTRCPSRKYVYQALTVRR